MIYLTEAYFYVDGHFQWGALQLDGTKIGIFQPLPQDVKFFPPLWDLTARTMRLSGKYVLPGLIDVHVHFRDMDQNEKETIETGSRAALHGGVTSVVNMPNTLPPATTVEVIEAWEVLALKNCYVNVAFLAGVPPKSRRALLIDIVEKPIKGFKIYLHAPLHAENKWINPEMLRKFLVFAEERNLFVCFHADLPQPDAVRQQRYESAILGGRSELEAHDETFPEAEEIAAVQYVLTTYSDLGNTHPIHFCHVSTALTIETLLAARAQGVNVSWEVTPHHLLLSTDLGLEQASFGKVLYPLRSESTRETLYRHVANGDVPIIATDHAPHTLSEKDQPFFQAPNGFPSVELLGPLLLTEIFEKRLPEPILECVTSSPADRFKFPTKGRIASGCDADLAVFEKIDPTPIDPENFFTKAKFSPYQGRMVQARVTEVFIQGQLVIYQGNERQGPAGTLLL